MKRRIIALVAAAATFATGAGAFALPRQSSPTDRLQQKLARLHADLSRASLRGELLAWAGSHPASSSHIAGGWQLTASGRAARLTDVLRALQTVERTGGNVSAAPDVAFAADPAYRKALADLIAVVGDRTFQAGFVDPAAAGRLALGIDWWNVVKGVVNAGEAIGTGIAVGAACFGTAGVGCAPAVAIATGVLATTYTAEGVVDSQQPNDSVALETFYCPSTAACYSQAQARSPNSNVSSLYYEVDFFEPTKQAALCADFDPGSAYVQNSFYDSTGKENVYNIQASATVGSWMTQFQQMSVELYVTFSSGKELQVSQLYTNPYFKNPTSNCV